SDIFLRDMRAIKNNAKLDFIAVLFDEIERISPGTASSEHWNRDRDFLLFWQSIRAGFQSSVAPFSFLIVGTNPRAVEMTTLFESDNPLFGNVEKRYIPMFTSSQVNEMVDDLGAIMGVHFNGETKAKLHADFGGHPFLTRYACSYIASSVKERPVEVDRTVYAVGAGKYLSESDSYVESVVGLLSREYPDEYEMLKLIGAGDQGAFEEFARADSTLVEHLLGYGIIERGVKEFYFRVGVVEKFFQKASRPARLLTQSEKIAELATRRAQLERGLRALILQVTRITTPKSQQSSEVLSRLVQRRRDDLAALSVDDLLSPAASPLYFDELKAIVLGSWQKFENAIQISKGEFEYHANTINRLRKDAHAKDVSEVELEKWRVSIGQLSEACSTWIDSNFG
ncbi:MAG: hypothetical protein ACKVPY_16555, partial [Paracoccaceae bacterium]